jgi:hypothetical protein
MILCPSLPLCVSHCSLPLQLFTQRSANNHLFCSLLTLCVCLICCLCMRQWCQKLVLQYPPLVLSDSRSAAIQLVLQCDVAFSPRPSSTLVRHPVGRVVASSRWPCIPSAALWCCPSGRIGTSSYWPCWRVVLWATSVHCPALVHCSIGCVGPLSCRPGPREPVIPLSINDIDVYSNQQRDDGDDDGVGDLASDVFCVAMLLTLLSSAALSWGHAIIVGHPQWWGIFCCLAL